MLLGNVVGPFHTVLLKWLKNSNRAVKYSNAAVKKTMNDGATIGKTIRLVIIINTDCFITVFFETNGVLMHGYMMFSRNILKTPDRIDSIAVLSGVLIHGYIVSYGT